ncbi:MULTISPECIES: Gfo/Idh/MocA family protein [Virgibacillus]|uniref:Gfo/Idh/MocA family oxidoreductase n=1 Tax=Virgibacillus siamensis TaxID=480071 RepID=A0ABN1GFE9_9BACI|nr:MULTISPECIES: Gfo/Idh/MocA family oxidoreductase [Virgibacillus]
MKFGTIGTSWITDAFIGAAKEIDGFMLTAVYSRTEEKAADFAKKHGAQHYFTDLEEMASSCRIDCVYVASPNSVHYEHVLTLLKHKKHVICEKPIFSNTKEWKEAYRAAEENKVYLFEAMRNIHSPNFTRLKENTGRIGRVRNMSLQLVQYSSRYDNYLQGERPNIFTAEFSGGALVDLGVYPLSVAVGLFGEPNNVSYYPVMFENGVDGSGTLVLTYDGFTSTIFCSKIANSFNSCEIHGEEGTLVFEGAGEINNLRLIKTPSKEESALKSVAVDNNMVYEIEHFTQIIKNEDNQTYEYLKNQSSIVLSVTEKARKQSGIVFGTEKTEMQ